MNNVIFKILQIISAGMIISLVSCNHKKIADVTIDQVTEKLSIATKSYDKLGEFHEGLAQVRKDGKYGFIDKLGEEFIPCQYDDVSDFENGISVVKLGDKEGVIDKDGRSILPCEYEDICSYGKDNFIVAYINGKAGLMDLNGHEISPNKYDYIDNYSEGLFSVRMNGLYGFIDQNGVLIIPCIYEDIYRGIGFSEGLAGVKKDGKWGYIDKSGNTKIQFKDGLTGAPFSSGLSTIYRGGISYDWDDQGHLLIKETPFEMAFINQNGDLACEFFPASDLQEFRDGFCVVTDENGRKGLMDTRGNFTIPCQYSFIANGFDEDYVLFRLNHKYGFARKSTGEVIIPCIYEIGYEGWKFCEGLVPVKKNGKYGFINEDNETVIPFAYDSAGCFSEGFAVVMRYGKYGYVDRYGNDTFGSVVESDNLF